MFKLLQLMRKLTHVFRWCLAALLLMVGTVVHARITGVATNKNAVCAGGSVQVSLTGQFGNNCQVSIYLVNAAGTQVGPTLYTNNASSSAFDVSIPGTTPGGTYYLRAISNCPGGGGPAAEDALGTPAPGAAGNTSAAITISAAFNPTGTIGWDNSLTAGGFSTTGTAVACLGSVTSGTLTLRAESYTGAAAGDFYYWYKDGSTVPVASGTLTGAAPDASFTISNPTAAAAGCSFRFSLA